MDGRTIAAVVAVAAAAWLLTRHANATGRGDTGDPDAYGPAPEGGPNVNLQGMAPSAALLDWLKRTETLLLTKTDLGDGGLTIGYGHFEKLGTAGAANMPDTISEADADALFAQDVEGRGAVWVREYVLIDLTQAQFDALTSFAFNVSPNSFAMVAHQLNHGGGIGMPGPLGQAGTGIWQFVRAGSQFEEGLRNRRQVEASMFESGTYA